MNPEAAAKLRAPFTPEQIGKLPKITCGRCSKAPSRNCDDHKKVQCRTCKNWITEKHLHLDYVGHATVTARLLEIDPEWTWEPLAFDENGLPAHDQHGNFWIKLTVCGVTRLGVGDGKSVKEHIGDAIRNAAMRFGVALDLWAKEDLHADAPEEPRRPAAPATTDTAWSTAWRDKVTEAGDRAALANLWTELGDAQRAGRVTTEDMETLIGLWKQRNADLQAAKPTIRAVPNPGAPIDEAQSREMHHLFQTVGWGAREDKLAALSRIAKRRLSTPSAVNQGEAAEALALLRQAADDPDSAVRFGQLLDEREEASA